MKQCFFALVVFLSLSSAACAEDKVLPWDATEKGFLTAFVAVNAVDCWQTHVLTVNRREEGFREVNGYTQNICGDRVAWYESAALKTAAYAPLLYFAAHKWAGSHKMRKLVLLCLTAVALEPVIKNEDIGGGVVFHF